jgi:hypothetical protein
VNPELRNSLSSGISTEICQAMNSEKFNQTLTECLGKLTPKTSGESSEIFVEWVEIFEAISGYLEVVFRSLHEQENKTLHGLLESLHEFFEFWSK